MSRYKFRKDFKVSSAEGIDKIPADWEVKQVRYLLLDGADGIKIGPFGSALKLEDMVENGYAVYGQENVIKKNFSLGKRKISAIKFQEMSVYQIFPQDILITMMGTSGKCEIVPDDVLEGIIDSHLLRVRVKDDQIIPEYFKLLVDESPEIFYQMKVFGKGSIMHGLNSGIVKSLKLPLPSVGEQKEILGFLDHETAKIDSLIEKQQKLIELLKEKRQAVISHAVTKGLNPDVPMKDSGVEWLGQVPEHWELVPLKHLCTFSGGGTPTKDNLSYWTDGTIPWVSPKDMKTFWLNETQDYITEKAVKESSTNMVEPHSLLMVVRSGILQRTIPIAINTVPVTMNQDMKALKFSKRVIVEYIADLIHGNTAQLLLEWSKDGATVESIEHEYLANSVMPVPPLDEQEAIVEMIARKMQVYKDLTSKAEAQIILLQERRTALISSAVTGKIDVRNWQNPNHNNNEAQMELSQ